MGIAQSRLGSCVFMAIIALQVAVILALPCVLAGAVAYFAWDDLRRPWLYLLVAIVVLYGVCALTRSRDDEGIGSAGRSPRERGRHPNLRHSRRRKPRRRRSDPDSSIELVLTRHEQAAAFMAATYGRLTGRPGVCITTLGPGALNLTTGAAYALLGAMPMIMITGQKGILSSRQARFQVVDVVAAMKPLTKLSRQIVSAGMIPTLVREAFRVAEEERPGPVHLELPEDIAAEPCEDLALIPPHPVELPLAGGKRARPRSPVDHGGSATASDAGRRRISAALDVGSRSVRAAHRIPYFTTQMGKGTVPGGTELYMGTAALSERDYVHEAIDRADLIIAIGHDTIEKPPFIMGPHGPKVVHVGYQPANVSSRSTFRRPRWSGTSARRCGCWPTASKAGFPNAGALLPLREGILNHIADRATEERFTPQRLVHDIRQVMPRTASLRSTTACTRSGSPATTAPRRQHAAARQCARHDGRGPALGDDGGDALPAAARHGRLRRRRLHDEQPGDGNRGALEVEPRGAGIEDGAYGMIRWKQASIGFPISA
jgi:acetolactate synthase I/II/III large subunit